MNWICFIYSKVNFIVSSTLIMRQIKSWNMIELKINWIWLVRKVTEFSSLQILQSGCNPRHLNSRAFLDCNGLHLDYMDYKVIKWIAEQYNPKRGIFLEIEHFKARYLDATSIFDLNCGYKLNREPSFGGWSFFILFKSVETRWTESQACGERREVRRQGIDIGGGQPCIVILVIMVGIIMIIILITIIIIIIDIEGGQPCMLHSHHCQHYIKYIT